MISEEDSQQRFKLKMMSKIILLWAVAVVCQATGTGLVSTGVSTTIRRQDNNGNYDFSYDITDAQGASNFRRERGDADGSKQGSYGLKDTDGRSRTVDYIADTQGYRAVVKTNEQGTAFSAPAGVVIDSPYDLPKAPEPLPIVSPAPVARPPPVAHPAPIGVAFPPTAPAPVARPPPVAQPAPIGVAPESLPIVPPAPVARPPPVAHPAPIGVAFPQTVPAPVARPPPVAHPAPIGVAFSPAFPAIPASVSNRVDIVHTVPVAPVHVVSPFTNVYPSPFIMKPVISRFGNIFFGGQRFIME